MALAANVCPYFPPLRIRQMEADLASLSRFWDEGPWGWSLEARRRYIRMGLPAVDLPDDGWLNRVRQLSSRAFACSYLVRLLREFEGEQLVGHHSCFRTEYAKTARRGLVFKSPWSSSGRGVIFAPGGLTERIEARLRSFLHTQGGYAEDKLYEDKLVDFALEFRVRGEGEVDFLGLSVFHTGRNGAYEGNVVAPQEALRRMIGADEALLQRLIDYHRLHLGRLGYTGPVGVDMMLLRDGRVHPVVEINFRRSMGMLAIKLNELGLTGDADLTPAVRQGFQAVVRDGVLAIKYVSLEGAKASPEGAVL
ncbi:MAG: hypothetical protein LUB62_02150 [Prevotellaceae bacterium]|nr:hypothetical protein [Prevotellaceae bacterium]